MRHVAQRGRCVFVEAGAHQGTLSMLAARMNCTVHAFDSVLRHLRLARQNLQLNGLGFVTYKHLRLGESVGSRLDEHVPLAEHISLLKMDIDGVDALAMRGADRLFSGAGVSVINLEFSPAKHRKAS